MPKHTLSLSRAETIQSPRIVPMYCQPSQTCLVCLLLCLQLAINSFLWQIYVLINDRTLYGFKLFCFLVGLFVVLILELKETNECIVQNKSCSHDFHPILHLLLWIHLVCCKWSLSPPPR